MGQFPDTSLKSFYRALTGEDRRRFNMANVCLGFEIWSRLYQEMVVRATQACLTDRLEEAYGQRAGKLRRQEEELQAERAALEVGLIRLEGQN